MTITDLTFKLIIYFFDSLWHFLELMFLISFLRGTLTRGLHPIRNYIERVKANYRARMIRKEALPNLKQNIPPVVKQYTNKDLGLKG